MVIDVNSDPARRRRSDTLAHALFNMQRCRKSNGRHTGDKHTAARRPSPDARSLRLDSNESETL